MSGVAPQYLMSHKAEAVQAVSQQMGLSSSLSLNDCAALLTMQKQGFVGD